MTFSIRHALVAGLIATAGLATLRADVLTDLGIAASEATQMAVQAVTTGGLPWGTPVRTFKTASPAQRTAIVKNVMAWAKTFTATSAFASAYAQARDHMKPAPPAETLGVDEQMKKQMAELDKSEAEMKKQFANNPEMLKQMLTNLETARKQMQEMWKNPQVRTAYEKGNVEQKKSYEARLATFDAAHPADVRSAIAVQLHSFLNACGDVDFGAALKSGGSKKQFVDERYEDKPEVWKICYRAGKEPVETARALAQEWLKELGQ